MSNKPRLAGPRFKITDIVEIASSLHPQLSGRRARVIEVRENLYSEALDKYVVLIERSTERQMLWDIELKSKQPELH